MTTRLADNTQTISRVSRLLQARSDRVVALYRKRPSELASRQRNGPASNACHLCTASLPFSLLFKQMRKKQEAAREVLELRCQ
jgi:hypothetical protein